MTYSIDTYFGCFKRAALDTIGWHDFLKNECGIPLEYTRCIRVNGMLVVYFTTSNLCAEEFIESLARNKGLPALTLATDSTHHIWSFEVGS